jgi:hypothetical protein
MLYFGFIYIYTVCLYAHTRLELCNCLHGHLVVYLQSSVKEISFKSFRHCTKKGNISSAQKKWDQKKLSRGRSDQRPDKGGDPCRLTWAVLMFIWKHSTFYYYLWISNLILQAYGSKLGLPPGMCCTLFRQESIRGTQYKKIFRRPKTRNIHASSRTPPGIFKAWYLLTRHGIYCAALCSVIHFNSSCPTVLNSRINAYVQMGLMVYF